ncbi:MAG: hypothetical protein KA104_00250 [Candidatus Pacebacteria bacterium]|nr:hypothetical protein [Candidatus Paceibacterota bacterium]
MAVLDRAKLNAKRNEYLNELENCQSPEEFQFKLAAMAHAMQMTLSLSTTATAVPAHKAFESIMRAVAHGIEGNPEMRQYVLDKMTIGLDALRRS